MLGRRPVPRALDEHREDTMLLDDVEAWRCQQLMGLGLGAAVALELAVRRDVDLHEFQGLVDRGCTPDLAARILG